MNTPIAWLLSGVIILLLQACDQPVTVDPAVQADDRQVSQHARQLFMPGLDTGELNTITISRHGTDPLLKLERDGERWALTTLQAVTPLTVPANMSLIKTLLLSLGNARVLEQKTAEEDWFKYLGVNDIQLTGARGTLLALASGDKSWLLIVGDKSSKQQGQYWREVNGLTHAVMRVDQLLDLPGNVVDWMDREIIDLPDNGVASISINSVDGQSFNLQRESHEQDLVLGSATAASVELPNSVKQLIFGLSRLNFDAIEASATSVQEEPAFTITFGLFDGTSFILSLYPDAEGSWCELTAVDNGQGERAQLVTEINRNLSRWRYHLSSQRTALYIQSIEYLSGEGSD
ncbi:MAG: DUF4340 domain-containing protein [Proteobacteria bacterium]|nr:DUF4340 domain-containing protein [Pseudomonadota bacterium]